MDTASATREPLLHPTPATPEGDEVAARWRTLPAIPSLQHTLLDPVARLALPGYQRNIEHCIGAVRVPLGIAGPLRVRGRHARGDFQVPLATTEATLVASYARGARLVTAAGGCNAVVLDEGLARTPGFVFDSVVESCRFAEWLPSVHADVAAAAHATTRHGLLVAMKPLVEGNRVLLDLVFRCGDAAGQNMVTIAAEAACRFLLAHAPVAPRFHFIESNGSGDKKASARTMSGVRGRRVSADIRLPAALVRTKLHVEPGMVCEYARMAAAASMQCGTIGVQGHYANGLAALYLACGQDVACVAEAAIGITRFELTDDGDLYAAVTLPSLVVGTVGGGTALPTQRACLELLGLAGAGHAAAFAEVCAALVLAGEISIIGALAAQEFAAAHQRFARSAEPGVAGG